MVFLVAIAASTTVLGALQLAGEGRPLERLDIDFGDTESVTRCTRSEVVRLLGSDTPAEMRYNCFVGHTDAADTVGERIDRNRTDKGGLTGRLRYNTGRPHYALNRQRPAKRLSQLNNVLRNDT